VIVMAPLAQIWGAGAASAMAGAADPATRPQAMSPAATTAALVENPNMRIVKAFPSEPSER
jgi:hypothetical protein